MGPQPAPPVQRWLEFFGLSPEQAYEKQLEHARGFTEEHNHYNGVLSPQQYIDVWLLLFGTAPGNAKTGHGTQAQNMILTYLDREGYDQQPQGFQKAKQWLQEAQTPQEAIVRVLHVLASRGGGFCSDDEKKVYSINWDWAYTFRRALRQEVKSRTNHYMQQLRQDKAPNLLETFAPFDDAKCRDAEAWRDARLQHLPWEPSPEPPNNCWLLDFSEQMLADCTEQLGNFVKVLDCLLQGAKADHASFTVQPSVAVLRYAQACATIKVLVQNKVFRAEMDGDHGLPEELFQHLCATHTYSDIQLGNAQSGRLTIRFLKGFDTRKVLGSPDGALDMSVELPAHKLHALTSLLDVSASYLGADIRCPEGRFTKTGMLNLMKLREALAKAYKQRFTRSLEQPMKLRPHVAESNMDENRHDELKEQYARENLSILLDALEEWDFRNKLHGYKVDVRLGHMTATTIAQALRQRNLGLSIELNSISNLVTSAVKHAGHLPILKIVIADALHRYHKNDFHVMLNLTCNCDGNGVMGSDLKSEYLLNISLVDAFMKGQTTECQVAGRTITLDPCVYVWDADSCELLLPVVKPDFAKQLQSWLDAHCADNMQPCKIRVYGTCFQDWFFEDYLRGHDAARFVFGGQPLPRLLGAGSFLQHLGINK